MSSTTSNQDNRKEVVMNQEAPRHVETTWTDVMAAEDEQILYKGILRSRTEEMGLGEARACEPDDLVDEGRGYFLESPVEGWSFDRSEVERRLYIELEAEYKHLLKLPRGRVAFLKHRLALMGPDRLGLGAYIVEGGAPRSGLAEWEADVAKPGVDPDTGEGITPLRWVQLDYIDGQALIEDFGKGGA
jgi:hypothetical protein